MTTPKVGDALFVSQSPRRQLPTVGIIAAFLCVYVLLGAFGVIAGWLMWAGVAVFGRCCSSGSTAS